MNQNLTNLVRLAHQSFYQQFGATPQNTFMAPSRVELLGNHTDHNGGVVLAAAVSLYTVAAASPRDDGRIVLTSGQLDRPVHIQVGDYSWDGGQFKAERLIKGLLQALAELGARVGGVSIAVESSIPIGSGLSSSASFELVLGMVWNYVWNDGRIPRDVLIIAGHLAENRAWCKCSGLLDQSAIAVGGVSLLDFSNVGAPQITPSAAGPLGTEWSLLVLETQSSHDTADDVYSEIPVNMRRIAKELGGSRLIDVAEVALVRAIPELRRVVGDRAILRALHFFAENSRVRGAFAALNQGDMSSFCSYVRRSGESSLMNLQNGFDPSAPLDQPVPLLLAWISRECSCEVQGAAESIAYRLHGGGFGGSVLVLTPSQRVAPFSERLLGIFPGTRLHELQVVEEGAGPLALE
jgi:galactokinase